jgi:GrpB-like predicted nucleotidyltransferase (UPF0157 family)
MAEPPLTGDDPPAWAVEGVHLCAYDSAWPARAAGYADELRRVMDRWLLGPIEHVGSTAVPDLVAKPVIDLMAQAINPGVVVRQVRAALAERPAPCAPSTPADRGLPAWVGRQHGSHQQRWLRPRPDNRHRHPAFQGLLRSGLRLAGRGG